MICNVLQKKTPKSPCVYGVKAAMLMDKQNVLPSPPVS